MAEVKEVLEWVESLCTLAMTEARGGDTALINRVGSNSALQTFMNNVIGTKSVTAANFPKYYMAQWAEITRLYEQYQKDEAVNDVVDKVTAIEGKLDSLATAVQALVEAQTAAKKQPKKPATVETVEAETEAETETTTEADAESEA